MVDNLTRNIEKKAFSIGVIVALGGILFRQFAFSIGMALGTLMSILNFMILAKKVKLIAGCGSNNAAAFFLSYIFRYLLMGIGLWICINRGFPYFLGAACGLFTVRLAIYAESIATKT